MRKFWGNTEGHSHEDTKAQRSFWYLAFGIWQKARSHEDIHPSSATADYGGQAKARRNLRSPPLPSQG